VGGQPADVVDAAPRDDKTHLAEGSAAGAVSLKARHDREREEWDM